MGLQLICRDTYSAARRRVGESAARAQAVPLKTLLLSLGYARAPQPPAWITKYPERQFEEQH